MKREHVAPVAISSDAYFFEKDKSESTLILGIGNYLMGDEGVGVQLIQFMDGLNLPSNMDILDGGTGGFLLLSCIEAYGRIIFVDATMDGKEEGTISVITPKFASDFPTALSVHDVGLKDMIEAVFLLEKRPEIQLITVTIREMKPMTLELSSKVGAAIPKVSGLILEMVTQQ